MEQAGVATQGAQEATRQATISTEQAQAAAAQATIATEQAGVATGEADRARGEADRAAETVASGVPDATTTTKGKIALAGDLGGTADAPTVPKLASKADLVGGFVPTSQLPAVALTKPHVVADRAGMLALDADEGDVAVITSGADKGTYMLGSGAPTSFSSWVRLSTPDAPVSSVNGQTGVVNLTAANVGAASSSHTHAVGDVTGLQAALDGKAPSSHSHTMSQITDLPPLSTGNGHAGSIPTRGAGGHLYVPENPSNPWEATAKSYVDSRTPRVQVVTALPASPTAGVVYLVTG